MNSFEKAALWLVVVAFCLSGWAALIVACAQFLARKP